MDRAIALLGGGWSHVAIAIRDKRGFMRVGDMNFRGTETPLLGDWIVQWRRVRILRPRVRVADNALGRPVVHTAVFREWKYHLLRRSSTHTYCTRHAHDVLSALGVLSDEKRQIAPLLPSRLPRRVPHTVLWEGRV